MFYIYFSWLDEMKSSLSLLMISNNNKQVECFQLSYAFHWGEGVSNHNTNEIRLTQYIGDIKNSCIENIALERGFWNYLSLIGWPIFILRPLWCVILTYTYALITQVTSVSWAWTTRSLRSPICFCNSNTSFSVGPVSSFRRKRIELLLSEWMLFSSWWKNNETSVSHAFKSTSNDY